MDNLKIVKRLVKIASELLASNSEKEVERLLKNVLKGTKWEHKLFAVGGYVRDELLGLEAKDLDIVIDNIKDGAKKFTFWLYNKFPQFISKPHQLGKGYPIWQLTFKKDIIYNGEIFHTKGAIIEFADTMKETFPDKNSRQRLTQHGTLKEDIERRDFTVNSLLKDLTNGEFKDLTGVSINDIKKGILRGNPGVDFDEILSNDPLRMIRLIRFQAKYNWKVPLSVLQAVKRNAQRIKIVSSERIRDELSKLGKIKQGLYRAIRLMKAVGLLKYIFPEIQELLNIKQQPDKRNIHKEGKTVFHHTLEVLKHAKPTLQAQLIALLHDVGKKDTQEIINNEIHFKGHEKVSGEIAEAILRRLKFDNNTIQKIRKVIENHMRIFNLEKANAKAYRRFIREIGNELEDVLDIAEADSLGNLKIDEQGNLIPSKNNIDKIRKNIYKYKQEVPVTKKPKLPLNGDDIMKIFNLSPGIEVGRILKIEQDILDEYGYDMDKKFLIKKIKEQLS